VDVLVISTACQEFRLLEPAHVARPGEPRVVIDCWRLLDRPDIRAAVDYVALGLGPSGTAG
jgi:hypothetical protein